MKIHDLPEDTQRSLQQTMIEELCLWKLKYQACQLKDLPYESTKREKALVAIFLGGVEYELFKVVVPVPKTLNYFLITPDFAESSFTEQIKYKLTTRYPIDLHITKDGRIRIFELHPAHNGNTQASN